MADLTEGQRRNARLLTLLGHIATDGGLARYGAMTAVQRLRVPASLRHISAFSAMVRDSERGYASDALGSDASAQGADAITKGDYTNAGKQLRAGVTYFHNGSNSFANANRELRSVAHMLHITGY